MNTSPSNAFSRSAHSFDLDGPGLQEALCHRRRAPEGGCRPRSDLTPPCGRRRAIRSWSGMRKTRPRRMAAASRPHLLFYGHYDVQPIDPLIFGTARLSSRASQARAPAARSFWRGACDDKGQIDDVHRGVPRLEGGHQFAPDRPHLLIEGEEEIRYRRPSGPSSKRTRRARGRCRARITNTGMWDRDTPPSSTLRGMVYEEVTIKARIATCTPGFRRRCREPDQCAHQDPRRDEG